MKTLVAFLSLTVSMLINTSSAMAHEAEMIVHRFYAQFQQPGYTIDDLLEFYADDVVFTDPTFQIAFECKDGFRQFYNDIGTDQTNYSNIRWDIDRVIEDGPDIAIVGRWSGQFYDCPFVDVNFVTIWRLEEGLISEHHDYFSAASFDQQVGWNSQTSSPDCPGGEE